MPAGDYANSRYSELAEITVENARNLKVAWAFSTGTLRGHEGQPLVIDSTMYVVTPFPNVAYAFDLTEQGQPLKWKFRPRNSQAAIGQACCDVVNRGAAYANGKIFYNLLEASTVAVDVRDGRQVWRTRVGNLARGETMTMAPIVVKNLVLVGNSGGELGVRGYLAALDIETGKEVWRAYSTGPDRDVKIGPRFKPFYAHDRGRDLGVTTWPANAWRTGAGAVWGWLSYDPELNLIYYGTSNPGPWNADQRPGDNKWTCAILARDADTGELVWAFQVTPHDLWDYDAVNENILVDLPIGGATRKVLVHFDRNGFAYVLDRATGEALMAHPYRANELVHGRGPNDWPPGGRAGQGDGAREEGDQHLPQPRGRKEPAAGGVLAEDRAVLRADDQPVHGLRGAAGDVHRRHTVHRRVGTGVRRPGRVSRRVHGVRRHDRAKGVGHS